MPITKWDDKAERDFLLAMRIIEHGAKSVTAGTWKKASEIMEMMGYQDVSPAGVSQHWSKILLRNFQTQFPQVLGADGLISSGTTDATATGTTSGTPSPIKKARQKRKRQKKDDDNEEEDLSGLIKAENKEEKNFERLFKVEGGGFGVDGVGGGGGGGGGGRFESATPSSAKKVNKGFDGIV
ncbi:hypothetical protein GGS21DRAFT_487886 [Xylaria nigripes]|nr:hypothetical protein GGS21DRAFT_487886 [Xylaria nigripes]